jgi:uncharacterized protein YbbC (DUF1343 family)
MLTHPVFALYFTVLLGVDRLVSENFRPLKNMRIGLLSMTSCCNSNLIPTISLFRASKKIELTTLFAPEHGLFGALQDQVAVQNSTYSGIRVYSIYGRKRRPALEALQNIDAVVIDLQDIGVRYYTFLWSAMLMIERAAKAKKVVFILDRPNPLNGNDVQGPLIDAGLESFVGLYSVPVRHGMTIGEMCTMLNHIHQLGADIRTIRVRGWRRKEHHDQISMFWSIPSPNMPHFSTAQVYPGMCLLEGTNVSEGRGTTRPFETFGAPWIDPNLLKRELDNRNPAGVAFRPIHFIPTFHKYRGMICAGLQVYVTDMKRFKPVETGLDVIGALLRLFPKHFRWRRPPYEYEKKRMPFDILIGNCWVREEIEKGNIADVMKSRWTPQLKKFKNTRKKFLFYA